MPMNRDCKYQDAWTRVAEHYADGYCVSERGLQASLASSLGDNFPENKIVVEPSWKSDCGHWIPDMVMLANGCITDIFELKFVPHHYASYQNDLDKLASYIADPDAQFCAQLEPSTGQWIGRNASLASDCMVHFVVVSRHDADAIDAKAIKKYWSPKEAPGRLTLWQGPVGGGNFKPGSWRVEPGI